MPIAKVQLPDGRIGRFEVPEGTTQGEVLSFAQGQFKQEAPKTMTDYGREAAKDMPWLQRNMAALATAPQEMYYGAKQLAGSELTPEQQQNLQLIRALREEAPVGAIGSDIATMITPGGVAVTGAKALTKAPRLAQLLRTTGKESIAPTTLTRAGIVGGTYAGMKPTMDGESRSENAALGTLAGVGGQALGRGLSRVLSPKVSPDVQAMAERGVPLTPGSIVGGYAQRIEQGLESIPVTGDIIRGSRSRSIEDWNKTVINKALSNIKPALEGVIKKGEEIPSLKVNKAGYEGVKEARMAVSKAYDDILPKVKIVPNEANKEAYSKFIQGTQYLKELGKNIPDEKYAREFQALVDNSLSKFSSRGGMSGEVFQQIESELGNLATSYYRKGGVSEKQMGDAIKELQDNFRTLLEETNPGYAKELSGIRSAYRDLQTIESASALRGSKEGIFTPEALASASKTTDRTLRKKATSVGEGIFQKEAELAERVFGSKVPDSGTPLRLMGAGLGLGYIDPTLLATGAGIAGAYTRPAQRVLADLLMNRSQQVRSIGENVRRLSPYTNPLAVGVSQQ